MEGQYQPLEIIYIVCFDLTDAREEKVTTVGAYSTKFTIL